MRRPPAPGVETKLGVWTSGTVFPEHHHGDRISPQTLPCLVDTTVSFLLRFRKQGTDTMAVRVSVVARVLPQIFDDQSLVLR